MSDRQITQDETWAHHNDLETKVQSEQWKHYDSPRPNKAHVQPSVGKIIIKVFWVPCRV